MDIDNLLICYPDVAADWDYELNDTRPEDWKPQSNKPAHWTCPLGHRYVSRINNRVNAKGNGCKYCAGQEVLIGFNDLESLYPDIAKQMHPTKNNGLKANMVTAKSNKKVWWLCDTCGMSWLTKVCHRVEGRGCPFCAGQLPIPGETDLLTKYPGIDKLWNYEKNNNDLPQNYTAKSHAEKFWTCKNGHTYEAKIGAITNAWDKRLQKGQTDKLLQCGCPVCNGSKKIIRGENDLESQSPRLMEEWDYENNIGINPWEIAVHSHVLIHWVCKKRHRWTATPSNRTKTGCPVCNANRLCPGENSLDVIDPFLASQMSPRNLPITPRDVTAFCNDKFYWICPEGHEWSATVANRHLGEGCPYCTHRKPIKGKNDLQTLFPEIASQLLPELNNGKKAEDFLPFSNESINWKCEHGHVWPAEIYCRTYYQSGCPYCIGQRPILGETDVATTNPELVPEYSPKNKRKIQEYTTGSNETVIWTCPNNHEWTATFASRTCNGSGCPKCLKLRRMHRKSI